jgi:hypothetical protein
MKQIFKTFMFFAVAALTLSSCLKHDLPGIKNSNLADISDFLYFYKYLDTTVVNEGTSHAQTIVSAKTITLNISKVISHDTVYVTPTFPANFPLEEKVKVSLSNICASASIPNAAKIQPLNGAPVLGIAGDYSKPVSYVVTAANGDYKTWNIVTKPLPAVSIYEGNYNESGSLVREGTPQDQLSGSVFLNTINSNTLEAQAGTSIFGNPIILYYIRVNPDNSVTILSSPTGVANG